MPKPSIIAVEDGVTITNPDAGTLVRWASERHVETCPQCRRGEELCPTGQRLQDATAPDLSWIPEPRTGD